MLKRIRKRQRRFAFGALSLPAMAVVTVVGLVSAGPVAAEERVHQASDVASSAVDHAKNQVGKPYRYGGSGPGSFDCSGLVQWSYKKAGKSLGRTTYDQVTEGKAVKRSNLKKGDLVFFYSGPSHVGIYVGDGKMVHAPKPGRTVEIVRMAGHWKSSFSSARRVA